MANHNATGKKAAYSRELVQRCRAAVLNALEIVEKKGKPIGQLLAAELEANPLKFMELAAKFCPRDLNLEAEVMHYVMRSPEPYKSADEWQQHNHQQIQNLQ